MRLPDIVGDDFRNAALAIQKVIEWRKSELQAAEPFPRHGLEAQVLRICGERIDLLGKSTDSYKNRSRVTRDGLANALKAVPQLKPLQCRDISDRQVFDVLRLFRKAIPKFSGKKIKIELLEHYRDLANAIAEQFPS